MLTCIHLCMKSMHVTSVPALNDLDNCERVEIGEEVVELVRRNLRTYIVT